MQWMFFGAERFSGDLSKWDVSKVTSMHEVFYQCFNFNSDLSRWDTSRVTDMSYMFYEAPIFNSDISNWDVSRVVEFEQTFYGAVAFNQDLSNWDISSGKSYPNISIILGRLESIPIPTYFTLSCKQLKMSEVCLKAPGASIRISVHGWSMIFRTAKNPPRLYLKILVAYIRIDHSGGVNMEVRFARAIALSCG